MGKMNLYQNPDYVDWQRRENRASLLESCIVYGIGFGFIVASFIAGFLRGLLYLIVFIISVLGPPLGYLVGWVAGFMWHHGFYLIGCGLGIIVGFILLIPYVIIRVVFKLVF